MSFPTIRFMTNAGENMQTYEDSEVSNKDRTIDSFVDWIKLKTGDNNITTSEIPSYKKKNTTRKIRNYHKKSKKLIGGKWSAKYKRSINCSKPKGFSQRQYCKYGRKNK